MKDWAGNVIDGSPCGGHVAWLTISSPLSKDHHKRSILEKCHVRYCLVYINVLYHDGRLVTLWRMVPVVINDLLKVI